MPCPVRAKSACAGLTQTARGSLRWDRHPHVFRMRDQTRRLERDLPPPLTFREARGGGLGTEDGLGTMHRKTPKDSRKAGRPAAGRTGDRSVRVRGESCPGNSCRVSVCGAVSGTSHTLCHRTARHRHHTNLSPSNFESNFAVRGAGAERIWATNRRGNSRFLPVWRSCLDTFLSHVGHAASHLSTCRHVRPRRHWHTCVSFGLSCR